MKRHHVKTSLLGVTAAVLSSALFTAPAFGQSASAGNGQSPQPPVKQAPGSAQKGAATSQQQGGTAAPSSGHLDPSGLPASGGKPESDVSRSLGADGSGGTGISQPRPGAGSGQSAERSAKSPDASSESKTPDQRSKQEDDGKYNSGGQQSRAEPGKKAGDKAAGSKEVPQSEAR